MVEQPNPPVHLESMGKDYYDAWLQKLIAGYAAEHVKARNWPAEGSLERSKKEVESLLPQGLQTEGHHLFTIVERATDAKVGHLWIRVVDRPGEKVGFIFDLEIEERHRRKGYATAAMLALEEEARSWGVARIGLHVFAHNAAATSLYESLGFFVTGRFMTKEL